MAKGESDFLAQSRSEAKHMKAEAQVAFPTFQPFNKQPAGEIFMHQFQQRCLYHFGTSEWGNSPMYNWYHSNVNNCIESSREKKDITTDSIPATCRRSLDKLLKCIYSKQGGLPEVKTNEHKKRRLGTVFWCLTVVGFQYKATDRSNTCSLDLHKVCVDWSWSGNIPAHFENTWHARLYWHSWQCFISVAPSPFTFPCLLPLCHPVPLISHHACLSFYQPLSVRSLCLILCLSPSLSPSLSKQQKHIQPKELMMDRKSSNLC